MKPACLTVLFLLMLVRLTISDDRPTPDQFRRGAAIHVEAKRHVWTLNNQPTALAVSPTAREVTICTGIGTSELRDAFHGGLLSSQTGGVRFPLGATYTPDGMRKLIYGGGLGMSLWQPSGAAELIPAPGQLVRAAAFSADGKFLAAAPEGGDIVVMDVQTQQEHRRLATKLGRTNSLWWSRDGKRLICAGSVVTTMPRADEVCAEVFEVDSRTLVASVPAHERSGGGRAAWELQDGRLLAVHDTDAVFLWDVKQKQHLRPLLPGLSVDRVCVSDDGERAAVAADRTVFWINATTGQSLVEFINQPSVQQLAFSANEEVIVCGNAIDRVTVLEIPESVRRREARDASPYRMLSPDQKPREIACCPLVGHTRNVTAVRFSPDGETLYSSGADQRILAWRIADSSVQWTLPPEKGGLAANDLAVSPDGSRLAVASGFKPGTIRLRMLDAANGQPVREFDGTESPIRALRFSKDSRHLIVAGGQRSVSVWDVDAGALLDKIGPAIWSRPASDPVDLKGEQLEIWESTFNQQLRSLSGYGNAMAISPNGERIAIPGPAGIEIRTPKNESRMQVLALPDKGQLLALSFSFDGRHLAAAGYTGKVYVWDLENPGEPIQLIGHRSKLSCLSWHPLKYFLATGGYDTDILIWTLPEEAKP